MRSGWMAVVALSVGALSCSLGGQGTELQATAEALAVQLTVMAQDTPTLTETSLTPTVTPETPTATPPTPTETSLPPLATTPPSATSPPVPTSTSFIVPDWPIVRQGNEGPRVMALQYLLRSHGHALTADGIFGPQTRSAVIAFQSDQGLVQDGLVGEQTWTALISGRTVRNGSQGEAVRAAQHLLRSRFGYSEVLVDGLFGPVTDGAVRDFQDTYDLTVDGIVGPITWKALVAIP
jgi:peptidoglycan hydrolase-like protein with peptidoglycan-binding domain